MRKRGGEGWQEVIEKILGEEGRGEEWIKAIEKMRGEMRGKEKEEEE